MLAQSNTQKIGSDAYIVLNITGNQGFETGFHPTSLPDMTSIG